MTFGLSTSLNNIKFKSSFNRYNNLLPTNLVKFFWILHVLLTLHLKLTMLAFVLMYSNTNKFIVRKREGERLCQIFTIHMKM